MERLLCAERWLVAPAIRAVLLGLMAGGVPPAIASGNEMLDRPFPYEANEVRIEAMLLDLTNRTGVPVIAADGLGGTVSLSNAGGSARDALADLTRQGRAVWWFDGSAIHVEPASAMTSRLVGLDGFGVGDLQGQMRQIGLDDPQYPLRAGPDAEMVRVVAPRGYVDAVAELAAHMAAARARDAAAPERPLPQIIRGRPWR